MSNQQRIFGGAYISKFKKPHVGNQLMAAEQLRRAPKPAEQHTFVGGFLSKNKRQRIGAATQTTAEQVQYAPQPVEQQQQQNEDQEQQQQPQQPQPHASGINGESGVLGAMDLDLHQPCPPPSPEEQCIKSTKKAVKAARVNRRRPEAAKVVATARGSMLYGCPFCTRRMSKPGKSDVIKNHAYVGRKKNGHKAKDDGQKKAKKDYKTKGCQNYRNVTRVFEREGVALPKDDLFDIELLTGDDKTIIPDEDRKNGFLAFVVRKARAHNFESDPVIQELKNHFPSK